MVVVPRRVQDGAGRLRNSPAPQGRCRVHSREISAASDLAFEPLSEVGYAMRCPSCDHDNRQGRRFCAECGGAMLAVPCAACGTSNEPGEKFCGGCGIRLTAAQLLGTAATTARESAVAAPAGERRQLTILFCDLVGSTPLSQQ